MSSQAALTCITPDRTVLAGMLVTVAVYCRDLQYDFILDDVPLILLNETYNFLEKLADIITKGPCSWTRENARTFARSFCTGWPDWT
jgi:hypothetical protein